MGKFDIIRLIKRKMSTDYFNKLDPPIQKRYKEKLEVVGNKDPYSARDSHFSAKIANFP